MTHTRPVVVAVLAVIVGTLVGFGLSWVADRTAEEEQARADQQAAVEAFVELAERYEDATGLESPVTIEGQDGEPGEPGETGERGPRGEAGRTGTSGTDGADGSDGAPGPAGAAGATGPQGPQGEQGPAGAPGPGPSLAEIAVAVEQFCTTSGSCVGPPGPACPETHEPRLIDQGPLEGWIACAPKAAATAGGPQ